MRRIEDIRPIKRERIPAELPPAVLPSEEPAETVEEEKTELYQKPKIKHLWQKITLAFLIIALVALFCGFSLYRAKAKISGQTNGLEKDYDGFIAAVSEKDLIKLSSYILTFNQKSESSLLILQSTGQDLYSLHLLYPKNQKSGTATMTDGVIAMHLLSNSYSELQLSFSAGSSKSSGNWQDKVNIALGNLKKSNSKLAANLAYAKFASSTANNLLSGQLNGLPKSQKESFENLKKLAETSASLFSFLYQIPSELETNFSFDGSQKSYLILFQNNAEIRPGGGFLGSFAKVDLKNGQLEKIDFEKNIYTLDKEFLAKGNKISPPKEISYLTADWTMRDSNMSPDFAESAKKVSWFYQQEAGEKVDGVIAIDTTLFRNLLRVLGPIPMPEYGLTVDADNFLRDVQYQVEVGYYQDKSNWQENQPKKILADMMPKFLSGLFKDNTSAAVGKELVSAVNQKHLLVYFQSDKLEELANGLNAAGQVKQPSGDYIYLSDANIGGYKSSLNIAETLKQNVEITSAGDINESVSIIRKHNGSYEWPDGVNNNFLKVMLPLSAKISNVNFVAGDNNPRSEAKNAEEIKYSLGVELGKSTVSFWQNTKPGETSQTDIEYNRSKAISLAGDSFDWQMMIQKQPGIESYNWQLHLVYPQGWKPQNVVGYDSENRIINLSEVISKDTVFRLRFIRD